MYSFGNDEKECLTVLVTANAAGITAPPMIVLTYKRVPGYIASNIPPSWGIGNSENGWMTSATFYEFMANIFEPWLTEQQIPRPILFFVDGHASHLTLHLSNFCVEKQIELIALFPNSTHLLQPMDVSVFRPLKNAWKSEVQRWRLENNGQKLQKHHFGKVFEAALQHITNTTISNGFKISGLFPFNVENVQFSKISLKRTNSPVKNTGECSPKKLLKGLESRIGDDKLKSFKDCFGTTGTWTHPVEDTELYNIWKNIKLEIDISKNPERQLNTDENLNDTVEVILQDLPPKHRTPPGMKTPDVTQNRAQNNIPMEQVDKENHEPEEEAIPGPSKSPIKKPLFNVPTPFKRALFWPEQNQIKTKRKCREKIPSVVTSKAWREYHTKKENEKKKKLEAKENRAKLREQKKIKKEKTNYQPRSESSEEDEEWVESGDSLDDVDIFGPTDTEYCETFEAGEICNGDYLLVKFLGGKRKTTEYR